MLCGCRYFHIVIQYICCAKRHFDFRRKIVALCREPRIKQILERADMKILEKGWNDEGISPTEDITYAKYECGFAKENSQTPKFSASANRLYREIFFTREQTTPSLDTIAYVSSGFSLVARDYKLRIKRVSSLPQTGTSGIFLSRKYSRGSRTDMKERNYFK